MLTYYSTVLVIFIDVVRTTPAIPGTVTKCDHVYYKEGDIKFGMMFPLHQQSGDGSGNLCSNKLVLHTWQIVEAFIFSIKKINEDPLLLPNITVGWVILDTCSHPSMYTARSVQFLPDTEDNGLYENGDAVCSPDGRPKTYRITAAIAPGRSTAAMFSSHILGLAKIPTVSAFATSDELSDKSRFPYLVRVAMPDRFQTDAMTDILVHFNWTYISVVYSEGLYGENGAKYIDKYARKKGLCIEVSYMIPSVAKTTREYMDSYKRVIHILRLHRNARVVILFLQLDDIYLFYETLDKDPLSSQDSFVWLISNNAIIGWEGGRNMDGAILFSLDSLIVSHTNEFAQYYLNRTPENDPENPWIKGQWEIFYDCQWANPNANDSCHQFSNIPYRNQLVGTFEKQIDAGYVLARGVHETIEKRCPEAYTDKSLLPECLKGEQLLKHIKNLSFQGIGGYIQFNEQGDILGVLNVHQYIYGMKIPVKIGTWDAAGNVINISTQKINWNKFGGTDVPESVCSKPCKIHEYYQPKELPCCWDCVPCAVNEIVVDQTKCEKCNFSTWPDELTSTECLPISSTYLEWDNVITIALTAPNLLGLLACIVTIYIYVLNKEKRLIKATSCELTVVLLVGTILAYVTVYFYFMKPAKWPCLLSRLGFNISVSVIYAPLLVKTNRVYRIFRAGEKFVHKPKLAHIRAQLIFCAVAISIQIVLSIVSVYLDSPDTELEMPVATEKIVELKCSLPVRALLIPLAYNILLLLLCAVHAFLTRSLPENFNESRFILISVITTSFLWIVFLPTYFFTFYNYQKSALLAFCLIVNASVTLLCMFLPKIYAIYFVDEKNLSFSTIQYSIQTGKTSLRCEKGNGINNHSSVSSTSNKNSNGVDNQTFDKECPDDVGSVERTVSMRTQKDAQCDGIFTAL